MDPKLVMYIGYLLLSAGLTAWVARVLFHNGQVFLDDALGDERLARSVNHLLVVGFYLVNLGYAAVAIRVSGVVVTASDAGETLSVKIGLVLLVLGAVHFSNLYVLSRFRRRRLLAGAAPPPPPAGPPAPARRGPGPPPAGAFREGPTSVGCGGACDDAGQRP